MLVRAVAGVDDAGIEDPGEEMGGARGAVADDDEIYVERLEVARGVLARFTLLERRGLGVEVDDVSREPLLGQFEAGARAGGGFDKQVDDGLAAQGGDFLDGALADGLERPRGIQHGGDFLNSEGFDVEQMFAMPAHEKKGSVGALEYWGDGNPPPVPFPLLQYSITPFVGSFLDYDFIRAAHFRQPHADALGVGGGDVLADEIRFDRQIAVTAVNQHGQLNAAGSAEVIQRVHGGPDGPPAEQHIIDQHNGLPGHVEWNDRRLDVRCGTPGKVVPVHADIQTASWDRMSPNSREQLA